jgi:hypothetical protein
MGRDSTTPSAPDTMVKKGRSLSPEKVGMTAGAKEAAKEHQF